MSYITEGREFDLPRTDPASLINRFNLIISQTGTEFD